MISCESILDLFAWPSAVHLIKVPAQYTEKGKTELCNILLSICRLDISNCTELAEGANAL